LSIINNMAGEILIALCRIAAWMLIVRDHVRARHLLCVSPHMANRHVCPGSHEACQQTRINLNKTAALAALRNPFVAPSQPD
jgi:hypothetical protein